MFPSAHGIGLKKKHGQHFLRQQSVVDHMLQAVDLTKTSSVFEIGCGDGFLTKAILATSIERLWVFEIDPEWATYVQKQYPDPRMQMFQQNILDVDFSSFEPHKPWTLLANLPYQITFPILHMLFRERHLIKEGVIMVQEEVAQKIIKTEGRGYGFNSLFFQHYFEWQKLDKIPPTAFLPPPKVFSRLLYFKPKQVVQPIPQEEEYWQFIKMIFKQPRRTFKNNLTQTHYALDKVPADILQLRAQQMNEEELIKIWSMLVS